MAQDKKVEQWNAKTLNQLNQGFIAVPLIGESDLAAPEEQDIEIRSIRALTTKEKHYARARELFILDRAAILDVKGGLGRGERNAVRKQLKSFLSL